MSNNLYKIDLIKWMIETIRCMNNSLDKTVWDNCWIKIYKDLGGKKTSGEKGCPKNAAYGIWQLGLVNDPTNISNINIKDVKKEYGKNTAYAVLAFKQLNNNNSKKNIWKEVKKEYKSLFNEDTAKKDQGAVRIAIILYKNRNNPALLNP